MRNSKNAVVLGWVLFAGILPGSLSRAAEGDAKLNKEIEEILEPIRAKHKLPALGAAIVSSKGLQAVAVVGVRKRGDKTPATVDDQFHLGSDTKAMTATMIALLVEAGKLTYDTTLVKAFPELKDSMPKDIQSITLKQLLTHHSGLKANFPGGWPKIPRKGSTRQQREVVLKKILSAKLEEPPGKKFLYSNLGYTLAGAMAERAADTGWEALMKDRIFKPLEMTSAGYGAMGTKEKVDQPWQHRANGTPVPPGPRSDNPPVMGPAGTAHMSLPDWAKFVAAVMRAARGEGGPLGPVGKQLIETPFADSNYTLGGWGRGGNAGAFTLSHAGSNTMNFAQAWVDLKRDRAILAVTNQGGKGATEAVNEAMKILRKRFMK
jgi:CubicO group peptidase (beta-lactamase class C family)